MIKYISAAADSGTWAWNSAEEAENHLLAYGLSAGERVAIHEVEVELANLNDTNVFILYRDCGAEFVKSPSERDKRFDDMVETVYSIKNHLRAWEYKMELTVRPIDEESLHDRLGEALGTYYWRGSAL
jgi:hypothetical protein